MAELVRSLAAREDAAEVLDAAHLPPRVIDAIRERLAALSPEATAIIEVASVAGLDVPAALLVRVSGASRVDVLTALDEAVRARVLRRRSSAYAFVHAIVRDAVYENMTDVRRMMLHRAYAEALEASAPVVEVELAALAHHYHSAAPTGTADKAFAYARSAARFALRTHAPEQAADLLCRSLELADAERLVSPQERLDLLLELGEAQIQARRRLAARDTFERAAAAAGKLSDRVRFARATIGFTGDCELFLPRDPIRLALLEEARRWLASTDDLELSSLVASVLSGTTPYWEDLAARRALSAEALELARRAGSTRAMLRALWARCAALLGPDHEEQYLSSAEEMLALSRASGEPIGEIEAVDALLVWQMLTGDAAGAARSIATMERLVRENHFPLWTWWTRSVRTTVALVESRFDDARRLLGESEEMGAALDNPIVPPTVAGQRLELAFLTGEYASIGNSLETLRQHSGGDRVARAMTAALTAPENGQHIRAFLDDAFPGDLTSIPRDESWLLVMSALGDAIAIAGDMSRMQACYDLLRPYEDWNAVHMLTLSHYGPVARVLGRLASGLGRPAEASEHFERALEMADRSGARAARCATLLTFASFLGKSGAASEIERSRRMASEARSLADELGAKLLSGGAAALVQKLASGA